LKTEARASSSFVRCAHTFIRLDLRLLEDDPDCERHTFRRQELCGGKSGYLLARNSIHNILLIDGDLRRPTLDKLLGAPSSPGLSDYLEGKAELHEIMQRERSSESEKSSDGGRSRT